MSIADELITRGWFQGGFQSSDGRVCLAGAAECATTGRVHYAAGSMSDEDKARFHQAWDLLEELVGGAVGRWNDDSCRTFDEVLRVAKEADELLSKETL